MGLLGSVYELISSVLGRHESGGADSREYPINDEDFVHNLTGRCGTCDEEFYWFENDHHLTCHRCDTEYSLSAEDFPDLLRAKCWNCGRVSEEVTGFRAENINFDCPYCEFVWESDTY